MSPLTATSLPTCCASGEWRGCYPLTGPDVRKDPRAMSRLLHAVEEAKKLLSFEPYAHPREEYLAERPGVPVHLDLEVSREDYEPVVRRLIESTLYSVHQALGDAGERPDASAGCPSGIPRFLVVVHTSCCFGTGSPARRSRRCLAARTQRSARRCSRRAPQQEAAKQFTAANREGARALAILGSGVAAMALGRWDEATTMLTKAREVGTFAITTIAAHALNIVRSDRDR